MIETILQATDLGVDAIVVAGVVMIYQRLGRVEKDVEKIAEQADAYNAKVDRMEGRFDNWRKAN